MPIPIPNNKQIIIERKAFPAGYHMSDRYISKDHYGIIYILSGDRRTISPDESFSCHPGNVVMMPLCRFGRTVSESSVPYDRYLVIFRLGFVKPFIENVGKKAFDEMYDKSVFAFDAADQYKLVSMLEDMLTEYSKKTEYKEFILQSMLSRLLSFIWENKQSTAVTRYVSPLSRPVLDAMYYIESNYRQKITLEGTAKYLNFSSAHLSRIFSRETGTPFSEYLIDTRIKRAQYMLAKTDKTIGEYGYQLQDKLHLSARSKT